MRKALTTGLIAAIILRLMLGENHDAFFVFNMCFWTFVVFGVIGWMSSPVRDPWEIDYPAPLWSLLDADTAIHAVKSVLLEAVHKDARWRVLGIDPCLGVLTATLDLIEPASETIAPAPVPPPPPDDDSSCERLPSGRRNILLIAEIKEIDQRTRLILRWRVRGGRSRVFCNQVIDFITARIALALRKEEACQP